MDYVEVNQPFKNLNPGLEIPVGDFIVFTGPNNSGKSAILQYLNIHGGFGRDADYISPRRFDTSNQVPVSLNFEQEQRNYQEQRKGFNQEQAEFPAPDPIRDLIALNNADRAEVIKWHGEYFGELRIERSNQDNEYSAPRVTIDGRLTTQQGSGSRAVLTVLCKVFDSSLKYLFIDEPEIGLEPQIQRNFQKVLKNVSKGSVSGHKKRIGVATHSHLFVDRETISNNYVVTKESDGSARIRSISTEPELHDLVFRLLGNSPADLFFPRNIVIVEGPSDREYLSRIFALKGIEAIALHYAEGAANVDLALPAVDQMLKTTTYLPLYRSRICILVDKQSRTDAVQKWREYLGDPEGKRVVELEKRDIENYYPMTVLSEITGLQGLQMETELSEYLKRIKAGERTPSFGRFSGGKVALARAIGAKMTVAHLPEVDQRIINLLEEARRLGL